MEEQNVSATKTSRESGAVLHQRETNRQIYLPFLAGIALLAGIFLMLAIPSDPVWRDRARAIGDFLYTLLCIIPILLCLFPLYVMVLLGIFGMRKLHSSTERSLRKLENLTESLAKRIETATAYVNEHTITLSSKLEPLEIFFKIFTSPDTDNLNTQAEETSSDE